MAGDGPVVVVGGTGMLGGQVVTELLSRGVAEMRLEHHHRLRSPRQSTRRS
jgi:uncharacterized protein YbjT (DUF2867 family)